MSEKTFEIAWELMKSDDDVSVSVGNETVEVSAMIGNHRESRRYSGYTKEEAVKRFKDEFGLSKSDEKGDNAPTNPGLWAQAKSKARSKFKVYPSAYANGWAAKWYKSKGGGWKKKGKKGKKVKKSDDEGWTDNDLQCRMCKYVQTPEEWEAKNCKMCGTKNMIHPFWR